jgi:hypothetical protein
MLLLFKQTVIWGGGDVKKPLLLVTACLRSATFSSPGDRCCERASQSSDSTTTP